MKNGFDNESIDLEQLVRLVMTDLGVTDAVSISKASTSKAPTSKAEPLVNPVVPATSTVSSEEDEGAIRLTAHVVTLDLVRQSVGSQNVRKIILPNGAVITPSAKDEIKKRGWELDFNGQNVATTSTSKISPTSFSLSASNVPFQMGGSTLATMSASSIAITSPRTPRITDVLPQSSVAGNLILAFHALPLETIPKNFLDTLQKSQSVTLFKSDCVMATADRLSEDLAKSENKGILLTGYSAIASAICNRRPSIRGLVGGELAQMEADAVSLGANLLILDPARAGFFRLRQMMIRFAALGVMNCPSVLRKGLES